MSKTPDQQERDDLTAFVVKRAELQDSAYNSIRDVLRCDAEQLKHRGYKEHGQAVIVTFKYYQSKIDQLMKEYLKKHPD